MLRSLVLALAALATVAHAAPRATEDFMFQVNDRLELDLTPFFGDHPVTVAELGELARAAGTYDAFLAALRVRAPAFFENYVLLHGTGSLQHASPDAPRVLLFGDGLVLALAEDPGTSAREVEVLAFDRETAGFRTAELRFASGEPARLDLAPAACAACHGERTKPLWEPYDFWPTVYGAAISRPYSVEEKAAYQAFFARAARAGVYAYLTDHARAEDDGKLDSVETFTLYVANLNFLRIARQLRDVKERLAPVELALFGALARCSDGSFGSGGVAFADFLPPGRLEAGPTRYADVLASVTAARRLFKARLLERYGRQFPGYHVAYAMDQERLGKEAAVAAQVRYLLGLVGLEPSDFPTSAGANRDFLSTPSNFGFDWLTALATFDRDGLLAAGASSGMWVTLDCAAVAAKSRATLASGALPERAPAGPTASPVLGRCQGCHSYPAPGVPLLPFDDTVALRRRLREQPGLGAEILRRVQATDQSRMPPDAPLSAGERASLEAVLTRLAPSTLRDSPRALP